ncbi:hypothetical protein J2797_006336 [Paraburkholderia terricola]|uniref:hypothetical protein n=1 Tax=Paraburkholderia terricola TaxID=169427 RepID=UPI00285B6AA3|nr:hypothetical protein [Paraburkholderia terricola]MDR6496409.1 hypothetical protein [Paraburkholderia terricola]
MKFAQTLIGMVCGVALIVSAHAQSATDLQTIGRFVECKLDARQIDSFIDRIDSGAVRGFTSQPPQEKAVNLAWKTQKPIQAWGTSSNLVSIVSPRQMLLAIPAPEGEEINVAKQWVARIGGMSEGAGTISLRENAQWRGVDYRKTVGKKEIRLLVDQQESPGWILLGCRYDKLFTNSN